MQIFQARLEISPFNFTGDSDSSSGSYKMTRVRVPILICRRHTVPNSSVGQTKCSEISPSLNANWPCNLSTQSFPRQVLLRYDHLNAVFNRLGACQYFNLNQVSINKSNPKISIIRLRRHVFLPYQGSRASCQYRQIGEVLPRRAKDGTKYRAFWKEMVVYQYVFVTPALYKYTTIGFLGPSYL